MKTVKNRHVKMCLCTFTTPRLRKKLNLRSRHTRRKRDQLKRLQFTDQEYDDMENARERYDEEAYGKCEVNSDGVCTHLEDGAHTKLGVYRNRSSDVCKKCGYGFFELIPHSAFVHREESRPHNLLSILEVPNVRYYTMIDLEQDNQMIEDAEDDY